MNDNQSVESLLRPGQRVHGTSGARSRLLRHDLLVLRNVVRATFGRWPDRLLGALILTIALAGARSWIAQCSESIARWLALAVGIIAGLVIGRGLNARLAYQQCDGLLAADALQPTAGRRYIAAGQVLGLFLLIAVTLVVSPSLLLVTGSGYAGGAVMALLIRSIEFGLPGGSTARAKWTMQAWSGRPVTVLVAAALLLLLLLSARSMSTAMQLALAGTATVLIGLMLSRIDVATVHFEASTGHGLGYIFIDHAKGLVSFLAVAVAASWAMMGVQGAALVAAAAGVLLLLFVLRILAYRLLERRGADLLVSVMFGLLVLMDYSLPPALPVIAVVILWQLQRHGQERRWLVQ